uniref:Reverse transcriptase Ty1/copia-type domain-containing protein n=1 Tax=Tanacetum cinerariifolium TaxID=118510 RepID=A0A6L2NR28_TANCI|nr:hypothetical protein [Tanacetum cinerariifolium]
MRPFGCPVTILNTLNPLGKFDGKADEGFLVRYYVNSKAFRVFNSRTRIVQETLHINFLENKPNVVGIGPKWMFYIDTLTMSMHYQLVVAGNQPNDNACIKENLDAEGLAVLELTNSSNTASPSVNDVSPNFVIIGKSSIVDPSKYLDDLDMPELEDIVYSDDEEDVGAEADLSNLETNIPLSPILTTKVYKDHPVNQIIGDLNSAPQTRNLPKGKRTIGLKWVFKNKKDERAIVIRNKARIFALGHTQEEGLYYDEVFAPVMDVKSAFLYGTIKEEVYICQTPGFEDPNYPDKVYKVVKAIYGLHQASKAWYVYVDDIIFGSTNKEMCKDFEKLMKDKFQMSSIRELTFFLGLQVKQKDDGIFISQDKYVAEILRKFSFTDVKPASTPIETEKPLLKGPDGEDVDVHIYRSMIGTLMYLTSFRPDIMFVVCACARFQVTLKVSHLHAVKRIFRCLKGKPHLGLWYPKDSHFNLVAYYDSDYPGASLDRKSTTGDVVLKFYGFKISCWTIVLIEAQQISNESHLLGVNTPRCDEDSIELKELMVFMATATVKKVNDAVQFGTLIDGKKVVVSEAIIKRDFHLDDADGVECLSNEEIFEELPRMGYENANSTAWNEFSCSMATVVICLATVDDMSTHNTRYTSPALTQKVFTNMRRVRKGFSGVETPLFAFMMVQPQPPAEEEVEMPIAPAPLSPTISSSPPPQDPKPTPHATSLQDQPFTSHASPPQEPPTTPHESSMPLLTTLMKTCATLSQKVAKLEQDKHSLALEILQLKNRVKRLEKKKKPVFRVKKAKKGWGKISAIDTNEDVTLVHVEKNKEVVTMDVEPQGRLNQDEVNAASKGVSAISAPELVSAAEPTIFDDENVTMTMAQTFIKLKAEKDKLLYDLIAQILHDGEVQKAVARAKQEKDDMERAQVLQKQYDDKEENIDWSAVADQTLFKPDKDVEEPKIKRVADETLLQESFKKLRAADVLGSESTQEIPSNDPKEMTEEDVQNILEIVPVSEFKGEALQVKYPIIDWEIHTKDDVMILMLSEKLQVEEDNEMDRDLVMKIFIGANKPKIRNLKKMYKGINDAGSRLMLLDKVDTAVEVLKNLL